MPTTHVLFDFFGTLVAYSESRVEQGFQHSHEVLLRSGARIDYAKFLEDWSRTFDEFETRAQQSLDEYSMDDVCGQFLSRVLPGDPDQETVALFRDTYLREWNKGVRYIPGVRELIAELAASFTLVLVTNTHHPALVHDHLHCMGVEDHFATVVTSVEHGKRKPSAHIFCAALERSAGKPETSVFVGDSFAADYVGATNAGLRSLLIDPERRHQVPDAARLAHILDVTASLAG